MTESELKAGNVQTVASARAADGFKLPHLRWWMIGLVFLATLINYIDRLTVSVLAPVITKDVGLSGLEYAGISTWFLLAYTISQGLSGKLYDRVGVRRGFTISIIVWSVAAGVRDPLGTILLLTLAGTITKLPGQSQISNLKSQI